MIKTIFMDVDDTLYDEAHPKIKAELQVVEHLSRVLDRPVEGLYRAFLRAKNEVIDSSELDPNRNNRAAWYARMLEQMGVDTPDPEALSGRYWDVIFDSIEPYYDLKCTLPTLALRYDLYVLTDELLDIQEQKLAKLGLTDSFKGIVSSTHVGAVKPHPELFRYALAAAGATPETSLMIGDNPKRDIRGGRSVGMATGWLRRGRFFHADLGEDIPDMVITNYLLLPGQIEAFARQRQCAR